MVMTKLHMKVGSRGKVKEQFSEMLPAPQVTHC